MEDDGSVDVSPLQQEGGALHHTLQCSGHVRAAVWSPGGSLLATCAGADVMLWEGSAATPVRPLLGAPSARCLLCVTLTAGHAGEVHALAFSPGGSLLAGAGKVQYCFV